MEFWHFRECVMHSAAACAICTAMYLNAQQGITMVCKHSSSP